MNLTYKKPLLLAIAAGMGLVSSHIVGAAPIYDGGVTNGTSTQRYIPLEAKENSAALTSVFSTTAIQGATVVNGGDLDVMIYTKSGYPVRNTSGNSLRVNVTLTGGAVFTKKPNLICVHSGNTTNGTALMNTYGGLLVANGVSAAKWNSGVDTGYISSTATVDTAAMAYMIPSTPGTPTTDGLSGYSFTFQDGFNVAVAKSGACLLTVGYSSEPYTDSAYSGAAALAKGAGAISKANGSVSLNVSVISKDVSTATNSYTIPMVTFVTAFQLNAATTNLGGGSLVADAVVDVTKQSRQFTVGAAAFAGSVKMVTVSGVDISKLRKITGEGLSATDIATSATLTFSGPPIRNLGSVTLVGATANSCSNQTTVGTKVASSTGAAETITIALSRTEVINSFYGSGLLVCLNSPTSTTVSMDVGQVSVAAVSESTSSSDLGTRDLVNVTRNGTVVRVLNIPRGDGVDPFKINIRFYNASSQKIQNITGSLYGVDGKLIKGDMVLLAELAPNNVMRVTSADLMKLVGTPWTGRPWLVIQAPASAENFKVQALMVNPTGVVSNISTDALN